LLKSFSDEEIQMSANILSFTPAPFPQESVVVSNGDHRAAVAAERTDRRAEEVERLPFDLSALEEEGAFINVDATGSGILDRRLDWQALGVELPENTDVVFTPPRCGLLPNRFRRPLLTPVSQAHTARRKYSYHFRLTETLFETPAYRWVPWRAFSEFESAFNKARDNLNESRREVLDQYDEVRQEVIATFRQVTADSARRLKATGENRRCLEFRDRHRGHAGWQSVGLQVADRNSPRIEKVTTCDQRQARRSLASLQAVVG